MKKRTAGHWISGNPAPFATSAEKAWKSQIFQKMKDVKNTHSAVKLSFYLDDWAYHGKGYDLDNLCDPVFTVLSSNLGWFNGKQTNINAWHATKTRAINTGLAIQQIASVNSNINPSKIIFAGDYYGKLPNNARDTEIPEWIRNHHDSNEQYDVFGLALHFVNINRSIASLSDGLVKHVIDCLHPIIGGTPGRPDDHRIQELIVTKEVAEGVGGHISILIWEYTESEIVEKTKDQIIEGTVKFCSQLWTPLIMSCCLFIE